MIFFKQKGERNFHVFHTLLECDDLKIKTVCEFSDESVFAYLGEVCNIIKGFFSLNFLHYRKAYYGAHDSIMVVVLAIEYKAHLSVYKL